MPARKFPSHLNSVFSCTELRIQRQARLRNAQLAVGAVHEAARRARVRSVRLGEADSDSDPPDTRHHHPDYTHASLTAQQQSEHTARQS